MHTRNIYASFFVSLLAGALAFLLKLDEIPIRIWDEARLANSALHMYLHGFSFITSYDDAPDLWSTKPPLMIWLQATAMHIFGPNEFAIRLPAALSAIGTGMVLWLAGKRFLNQPWLGALAAVIYTTTYANVYIHAGRTGDYDALLVLLLCLSVYAIFEFVQERKDPSIYRFWIFLSLAGLTKGVAALLLMPGLGLFILLSSALPALLRRRSFYLGLGIFLFLVGGYYFLREMKAPGYLQAVWNNELGGRYLTVLEEHRHPFLHYVKNMVTWRNPYWWLFLLPSFLAGAFAADKTTKRLTLFHFLLSLFYLIVISSAQTKLEWYDLPLYPFFSLQIAMAIFLAMQWLGKKMPPISSQKQRAIQVLLVAAILFLPARSVFNYITKFHEQSWDKDPHMQGYFLQEALRGKRNVNGYVFCYEGYNGQLQFYTRILQQKGINVRLQGDVRNLTTGFVATSQGSLANELVKNYDATRVDTAYGCTVYLVAPKQ